jgi:hypothetical protein
LFPLPRPLSCSNRPPSTVSCLVRSYHYTPVVGVESQSGVMRQPRISCDGGIPPRFFGPSQRDQLPDGRPYARHDGAPHAAGFDGSVGGGLPRSYLRPKAAISVRVRTEPRSSGILGMDRRSRFSLRARSNAPRLKISRRASVLAGAAFR